MRKLLLFIGLLFVFNTAFSAEFYNTKTGENISKNDDTSTIKTNPVTPRKDLPVVGFSKKVTDENGFIHVTIIIAPNPEVSESLGACGGVMFFKKKNCGIKKINNNSAVKKVKCNSSDNKNTCNTK